MTEANEQPDRPRVRRSSRLAEKQIHEILALLSVGCNRRLAAEYAGCAVDNIRYEAAHNETFAAELHRAEAQHEVSHLSRLAAAALEPRYWRAAAWALERRYPDRYGARRPHTGPREQIALIFAQFTGILVEEVTDAACYQRVVLRLATLRHDLDSNAPEEEEESGG